MNNFLVDGNTGRVLMQDVRIAITGAQLEAYGKYKKAKIEKERIPEEKRTYRPNAKFIWFRYSPMKKLDTLCLDDMDYTRFVVLCSYMNYKGKLMKPNNTAVRTQQDIQNIFSTGFSTTKNFIKNIESAGLLEFRDEGLYINTDICYKGAYKPRKDGTRQVRIYVEALRKVYQSGLNGASKKNLFHILQMIPYMNLKKNVLCKNIYEEQENSIELLTFGEFCDIIGIDRGRAYRARQRLSCSNINGTGVLAFDGGAKADTNSVTISPAFICGTSNAEDAQRLLLDKFYKEVT